MSAALSLADALATRVAWQPSGDPLAPYRAEVAGARWSLRLNDFPEEPLYTLSIDGADLGHVDDWPSAWERPAR